MAGNSVAFPYSFPFNCISFIIPSYSSTYVSYLPCFRTVVRFASIHRIVGIATATSSIVDTSFVGIVEDPFGSLTFAVAECIAINIIDLGPSISILDFDTTSPSSFVAIGSATGHCHPERPQSRFG